MSWYGCTFHRPTGIRYSLPAFAVEVGVGVGDISHTVFHLSSLNHFCFSEKQFGNASKWLKLEDSISGLSWWYFSNWNTCVVKNQHLQRTRYFRIDTRNVLLPGLYSEHTERLSLIHEILTSVVTLRNASSNWLSFSRMAPLTSSYLEVRWSSSSLRSAASSSVQISMSSWPQVMRSSTRGLWSSIIRCVVYCRGIKFFMGLMSNRAFFLPNFQ